ncbi:response regulator [Paenibacillus sp. HB172176]|uniref:response regulator transcription factor n=1 Tax=Paenibacillus sp. HB172176 TaxID=2493690 RepID=UPI001439A11D|nr:response regulator [Paenibacillus sp. HB172176]
MEEFIRLLIVDDEDLLRERIRYGFSLQEYGYHIVAEANDGEEAIDILNRVNVDVVITDIVMPRMDGLELTQYLKEQQPWVKVIILSNYAEFEFARKAVSFGALGYTLKVSSGFQELLALLHQARQEIEEDHEKLRKVIEERHRFNQHMPLLRKQFMMDLTRLMYSEWSGVERQFTYLNMPPPAPFLAVGLVQIDEYATVSRSYHRKDMALLQYALMQMLEEVCGQLCYCSTMPWNEEQTLLLLHWQSEAEAVHYDMAVDRLFTSIRESVRQFLPFTVSVSFSGIKTAYEGWNSGQALGSALQDAIAESKTAIQDRFYKGAGHKFVYSKQSVLNQQFDPSFRQELHQQLLALYHETDELFLQNAIESRIVVPLLRERCDPGQVKEWLKELAQNPIDNDPTGRKQLLSQWMQIDTCFHIHAFLTSLIQWDQHARIAQNQDGSYRKDIQSVLDLIARNYREPLTVSEVCEHIGISPNYFSHLFKKETGMNFTDYVTHFRILQAKRLLKDTKLKVQDISGRVGIPDYKYFSRLFRRTTGQTPSAYRESDTS